MKTSVDRADDELLERFGYQQQFARTVRSFESFALGFSFISITTGIFTTFGFLLNTAGPRGIWTWPIVIAGQALVAMVYGALAAKIPVSGYSYQWASRLTNPQVGWWLGWMSFAYLSIVTVSVDYAFTQVAFQPLIGMDYTPTSAALITLGVMVLQAAVIVWSTPITTRINTVAVVTEFIGIVELAIILLGATILVGEAHWGNLWSTALVPRPGWYAWLGPGMLATLLGAYTIVGFESSANLAEETQEPRRAVPRAMIRAVLISGLIGMIFLIALSLAVRDVAAASADAAPVAFILRDTLGTSIEKVFLVFICVSIFACGLVIMVTNSRLAFSMSRDRRLPGHQLLRRVPRATGGPTWATLAVCAVSGAIVLVLRENTSALFSLFTASTLMPAILYAGTVLLYVFGARGIRPDSRYFSLGRWEWPVILGALAWLVYELTILIGPAQFRAAQKYALGAIALGVVVYALMWLLEPEAMRSQPGAMGEEALEAGEEEPPPPPRAPQGAGGVPVRTGR
ncbi:MAG TPA: amino acid permease [Actinomycetes bacterium]|jgi:amino acid transporter|nr:amino acid permease [Actinomycetes bacterium]